MSVDTYLKGKNLSRYRTLLHRDVRVLIAPLLHAQARELRLDVTDYLLWRSIKVEAEPRGDHFHSPSCRH